MARYAVLSVSNKDGIVELGRALVDLGFTILSTGGTKAALVAAGIPVTAVSTHTGAPEIMDGRVKTLHPKIAGGILGDRDRHAAEAEAHGIPFIELVAVNLYPFEKATANDDDLLNAVENIDIGGPTMVRSAAKNHRHVTILVDPKDYGRAVQALSDGDVSYEFRRDLALKAFRHTSRYDSVIAAFLARKAGDSSFPDEDSIGLQKIQDLRYGENPHQRAAFYSGPSPRGRSMARLIQHQGKELSFNNLADADAAIRAVFDVTPGSASAAPGSASAEPACCIIKHMNPCGFAVAPSIAVAFARALEGDPVSAYGGILALNRPLTGPDAKVIKASKVFFEVIVAPGVDADAKAELASRENLRLLELPADWADSKPPGADVRRIQGGWLVQDWDLGAPIEWKIATKRAPTADEERALRFAWMVCRHVKSNAIVLARAHADGAQVNGVGAGQMNRVESVRIALRKATLAIPGSVLASDAFFPFADGPKTAIEAGITAIIQPGGSIRDAEVIAAADEAGVAMVFTGVRHFRH